MLTSIGTKEQWEAPIAFVGDWHQGYKYGVQVLGQLADTYGVKLAFHTGDFLGFGKGIPVFLRYIETACANNGITLYFVDGNHEDFEYIDALDEAIGSEGVTEFSPHIYHLQRGARWVAGGLNFLALGGATSLDKGYRTEGFDWFPQEALTYAEADQVIAGGQTDVLISHDCPHIVPIPGLRDDIWDPAALQVAKGHRKIMTEVAQNVNPTHIFHGHFHERYSAEAKLDSGVMLLSNGLNCDGGPFFKNYLITTLTELAQDSFSRRQEAKANAVFELTTDT